MSPLTEAQKKARYRAKKRAAAGAVKTFLDAVLDMTETDAAHLAAQSEASELLDRITTADKVSIMSKIAAVFGVKPGTGSAVYTQTETRRHESLAAFTARIKAGTATQSDIRAGLRIAKAAIRAERQPVDRTILATEMGYLLGGTGNPPPCSHYPESAGFWMAHKHLGHLEAQKAATEHFMKLHPTDDYTKDLSHE